MSLEDHEVKRFWSKVDRTNDCWLWTGGRKNRGGYGGFYVRSKDNTVNCYKIAFCLEHKFDLDEIPEGIVIRHLCNNPVCVRPSHLALGTHKDNSKDMVLAGNSVAGVRNNRAKMSRDKVIEIRRMWSTGDFTKTDLADMFDIAGATVWQIVTNRTWRDPEYVPVTFPETNNKSCKFTDQQVSLLRSEYEAGVPVAKLVLKYGISHSQAYNIISGRQRKGGV